MKDDYANMPMFERDMENKFSFWYDKIKNVPRELLGIPRTTIINLPPDLFGTFYMSNPAHDYALLQDFVITQLQPAIKAMGISRIFLKNAVLSDKFHANRACLPPDNNVHTLIQSILSIMQMGIEVCMGYDGTDELVLRERIPYNPRLTPCIYHGLPLRPEFRVFYDFDKRKVLFSANYWDPAYLSGNLYDRTDQVVFNHEAPFLKEQYRKFAPKAERLVQDAMKDVTGLSGPWSVDLLKDDNDRFWLIDMAVAEQSAYWERRPGYVAPKPEPADKTVTAIPLVIKKEGESNE